VARQLRAVVGKLVAVEWLSRRGWLVSEHGGLLFEHGESSIRCGGSVIQLDEARLEARA